MPSSSPNPRAANNKAEGDKVIFHDHKVIFHGHVSRQNRSVHVRFGANNRRAAPDRRLRRELR
jgi:hypothetical protein